MKCRPNKKELKEALKLFDKKDQIFCSTHNMTIALSTNRGDHTYITTSLLAAIGQTGTSVTSKSILAEYLAFLGGQALVLEDEEIPDPPQCDDVTDVILMSNFHSMAALLKPVVVSAKGRALREAKSINYCELNENSFYATDGHRLAVAQHTPMPLVHKGHLTPDAIIAASQVKEPVTITIGPSHTALYYSNTIIQCTYDPEKTWFVPYNQILDPFRPIGAFNFDVTKVTIDPRSTITFKDEHDGIYYHNRDNATKALVFEGGLPGLEVSLNAQYLKDAIPPKTKTVKLAFEGNLAPLKVTTDHLETIIMPVRLEPIK